MVGGIHESSDKNPQRIRPHAIENSVRVRCVYFLLVGAKKSLVLKKKFSFEKKLSFEGKVQQKSLQVVNGT